MNEVKVTIRLATLNDVDNLTDLHCRSFRPEEHVPMMLGRGYVKASYKWQVSSKETYVLVAEYEGKIAGLVAVCDGAFTKDMFIACLPEFIKSIINNPTLLLSKMLWKRLFRRPDLPSGVRKKIDIQGFAQMIIGAVDKDYRGLGVFVELVQATKDFSNNRGSKAIRAGIYKSNESSRRVFVKAGWTEVPELETSDTVFYVAFFDKSIAETFGATVEKSNPEP
jgi:ribosomal protein S18 acetylase RimI-like enzyme